MTDSDVKIRGAIAAREPVMLDPREFATMIAALRFWQREAVGVMDELPEGYIATDEGTLVPLTAEEIDALVDRINSGEVQPVADCNMLASGETIQSVVAREHGIGIDIRWNRDTGASDDHETEDCFPTDAERATIYLMTDLGEAIALHDAEPGISGAEETGRIVVEVFRAIAADVQSRPPCCLNCGQHLKDGSGICIDCGADLEGME